MGCQVPDLPDFLRAVFKLIQYPWRAHHHAAQSHHRRPLVDEVLPTAAIAGACNAVRRLPDGRLQGDMFDGEGFVRGVQRKGQSLKGARALVVGSGGVGSAIAASLAGAGVAALSLFDVNAPAMQGLAGRLRQHYPALSIGQGSNDPTGFDLVVNATPMGMNEETPCRWMSRLAAGTFVGEVVMRTEMTAFLLAAQARGCAVQVGSDMLFEQIPAYLEFLIYPVPHPSICGPWLS